MEKIFKERNVLLLNPSHEVLDIVSWRKAVILFFKEKVRIIEEFEDSFISSPSFSMKHPSILVAIDYKYCLKHSKKSIKLNKQNLMIRDNHACLYCGRNLNNSTGSIDHVLARSRGGLNIWLNCVSACCKCNRKKDNKTPEEAGMNLLRQPFVPTKDIFLRKFLKNKEYECWRPYLKMKSEE